jgi:hypothetical protein
VVHNTSCDVNFAASSILLCKSYFSGQKHAKICAQKNQLS